MPKTEAKAKIQALIDNYEKVKSSRQISRYSEEETKKDFIEPLFEALGWEVRNKNEVTAEEYQSNGRADYGFYLDGRLKFYVEAKSLKADLYKEEYANQAIRYSWNKGAIWTVLTDFENIKIFNAQVVDRSLADKLFIDIPYNQYLDRFDQLWLLSRESFISNLLDEEAKKVNKMLQKVSVSASLYKDLNECRQILTHNLGLMNKEVDKDLLDEGVQKLLDRLIFLRVLEDRGIEDPILLPLIRESENNGDSRIYGSMIHKFRELDKVYDSNLFSEHSFEKWEEWNGTTKKVVNILYGKKGYYEYDFKAMPADVLGGVYENYLGYRLEKSKRGMTVNKDAKKRKEQGIYYTPDFIVDYIVKNTLEPVLDKCKGIADLKKIKVLDPACGSGSFLIKALDVIYQKYLEFGNPGGTWTKIDILLNNIYGVDLDPQAVEIARLNLLISALDTKMKLPTLTNNIKRGNSLISDKKLDPNAFNWREEFPEVFRQGGFDVIVSNPPYVRADSKEKGYREFRKSLEKSGRYKTLYEKWDLFIPFIECELNLLNNNGNLGFIVSNSICSSKFAYKLLDMIQTSYNVVTIDYLENIQVFQAGVIPVIIHISKNSIEIVKKNIRKDSFENIVSDKAFKLAEFKKLGIRAFRKEDFSLDLNILTIRLGEICYISKGMVLNSDEINNKGAFVKDDLISDARTNINSKPYIEGKYIKRYFIEEIKFLEWNTKRVPRLLSRPTFPELYMTQKIMRGRVTDGVYDDSGLVCNDSIILFVRFTDLEKVDNASINISIKKFNSSSRCALEKISNKFNLKYVLAILNSMFANYFLNNIRRHRLENYFYPDDFRQLPIANISKQSQLIFVNLVNEIIKLNNELMKYQKDSDKWKSIKSEVERTDIKIDKEVYKLYDLTQKEIEIIEKQ